ncbi:hypothetical protein MY3296_000653 [Beauveria thailandica]
MEAAAKTVELLTQRTLPDTPYYLSNHPDWRYRPHPDDHLRPEEWHSTRLQYSTLLAEADRGVLLTRPDYDMREEPSKPVARDVTALSKAGGEKKKLSLSDYKNKKTAAASPPEPAVSRLRESERAGASSSKSLAGFGTRPAGDARTSTDPRRSLDARPSDARKDRSRDSTDGKQRPKDFNLADMSLPAKPPLKNYPLPPRPPSPGSKKRVADHDDDARPQKRSRPENTRPNDDRLPNRDDPVRKRNLLLQGANHRDSPLLNGKSSLPGGSASNKGASPANRSRGDSVNGAHPATVGRHTPKQESPKKSVVPPLLSPLRLGPGYDDDSLLKQDRRRADGTPPRPKKPEQPAEEKKRRPTRTLPALLSPTLPPMIEAALRQREQDSPEPDERPKEKKAVAAKRKKSFSTDESLDEMPGHHAELIVTLKIPKGLRKSFRRVMALPTANPPSRGRDRDRDPSRNDRDRSTDNDRQYARKRPPAAPEADSVAMKKSRSSDIPNASRRPTTPPRRSHTSMSRVNSNTATAHTPGESMRRTPSSTGTGDKRTNGVAPAKLGINELREKEERLRVTGKRLKHEAERAFKARHSAMANSKDSQPRIASDGHTTSPVKVGFMRALESILCFMHAFQAQDLRNIEAGRKIDIQGWTSLFPLIDYYLLELQPPHSARPALALLLMLQIFATDHILTSILAQPPRPDLNKAIIEHERVRNRALGQIREAYALIDNPRLRADISSWWSLDDVTETTLRVMRRWCAEEDVPWTSELTPRDYGR